MGCIFAVFTFLFPRFAFLMVWIARPEMVSKAFDTFLIPFFGVMVFPFTTLMYVILYAPNGIDGWDWIWIADRGLFRPRQPGWQLRPARPGDVQLQRGSADRLTRTPVSVPACELPASVPPAGFEPATKSLEVTRSFR